MGWPAGSDLCEQFYLLNRWSVRENGQMGYSGNHNMVLVRRGQNCYRHNLLHSELRFPDGKWVGPKTPSSLVQDSYLVDPVVMLVKDCHACLSINFEAANIKSVRFCW
jgi:hypothetical protein